jgi:phenylalanyl-tRNA synthetase beta chain
MKVPVSWLRELAETELSAAEIAARLSGAGIEVEGIEERGRELDGVVVGEIVQVDPHPQADRLVVCEVRRGASTAERIVCGARNMRAGDRVAVATPGARLADGRLVEAAEIRGVLSQGMLCSARELGLGDGNEGVLLLEPTAEVGSPLAQALLMADTVLDVAPTPNRGDCLSILGIARELAALQVAKLVRRRAAVREKGEPAETRVRVRIADPDLCRRYAARVVADVEVGPSPAWMQQRLLAAGMRPINNLVDVTNYVMLERGQPLHAFDLRRIPDAEITVRRAGTARRFDLLDGSQGELEADDLLITSGGEPVAVAGVMGGVESGVGDDTSIVLLESAWFHPAAVRRTSRRLGLLTESAYRFERQVDIEGVIPAIDRAAALLTRVAGGVAAPGVVDVYPRPHRPAPVSVRVQRVAETLGVGLNRSRIVGALKAMGAAVSPAPGGGLSVEPPSHRPDLTREVDFVEEVARLVGYEEIPTTLPEASLMAGDEGPVRPVTRALRELLAALGWCEAVPLSFTSESNNRIFTGLTPPTAAAVELLNPLGLDAAQMRRSLLSGLVDGARVNTRQGEQAVALFAIGRVFWRDKGSDAEGLRLAALLSGELPRRGVGLPAAEIDFFDLKGLVENVLERFAVTVAWQHVGDVPLLHPGAGAQLMLGGVRMGLAGGLHPSLQEGWELPRTTWVFELDLDMLLEYPPRRSFRELPRFPAVIRDLAIVAEDGFVAGEVNRFVREWGNEWIETVELFDQYRGAQIPGGKKSLAFSIVYRAADRTLTDEEVNAVHMRLTEDLTRALGVELRR